MNRCAICDHSCNFVSGDGPRESNGQCDFMFIGEKPGREEDGRGRPFIGMAGAEFNNHYLGLAGLERDSIYITNTVKCRLGGNNKPSDLEVSGCASHHIYREIEEVRPKVLVLMGATACSLVPKIELDKDHGIPIYIDEDDSKFLGGYCGPVMPMFHPASGLHDTSQMIPLMADFERLGKWWRGKWHHTQPTPNLEYELIDTAKRLKQVMEDEHYSFLPVDCEDDCGIPWSIQFSTRPGNGYLIRTTKPDLIELFGTLLVWGFQGITLHNSPGDLDNLDDLGITVKRFRDTMQESYQLGNQPQGLKALGWRLLGTRMRSWEDICGPSSRSRMIEWLSARWDHESDNRIRVEKQLKTKLRVTWKPTEAERAIKRILSHSHKPDYDLWEKAEEAEIVGDGMPRMSIANVPLDEAVHYACQDADITGQVATILSGMRKDLVKEGGAWSVDEGDWDR